ncbi:hypothetical protein CRX72_03670 [Pantoea sp. BRM17]|nr:hypothetical protein CRX72_03670 [Pantoea sp. BRM17]
MSKPAITLHYCTQCNWMLRSAWMAQELLQTFMQGCGATAWWPRAEWRRDWICRAAWPPLFCAASR